MLPRPQPAILASTPAVGRFASWDAKRGTDIRSALAGLADRRHDRRTVIGVGAPLCELLGARIEGLRPFPADMPLFPATQRALLTFVGGPDPTPVFDAGRGLARALGAAFEPVDEADAFTYRGGRDLSGFEDGTANPGGRAARDAAIISGRGAELDGGSFLAVQRWVHDLGSIERMGAAARNSVIGRNRRTNRELPEAPPSAHVRRTDQEGFDPPAFVLRRSMAWGGIGSHGLVFAAYGTTLEPFERQLRRMAGLEDGIVDALLSFSRAASGGYYFCPPLLQGRLDFRAIGIARSSLR